MRFLFLPLTLLLYMATSSQSPTMAGMSANMQQTINNQITNIQQQLTNAKANNAPPTQIKDLEQKLEAMKIAQKSISQYTARTTKPLPKGPPGSMWTGYLSAVKKGSATFPPHKREVYIDLYFNEAIPTLHRIYNENEELIFQDDKGIGSLKDHSEVMYGAEWLICDCNTVGEAELHEVVVNQIDGTYTIQATAPGCDDGGGSCGMTWDIGIPDEPLKNPNVLSGTRTYKIDGAGQSSTTVTMTWYLVRESNVELIVKPIDYNKWLPEPGKDEETVAQNILGVDVFLQGKNGKPLNHKAEKFLIRLENTSREPGITINYPVHPVLPAKPDLKLLEQPNANVDDDGQKMEIECNGCTKANFKIGSFDGGGYATLKVMATLDDESVVVGHLFTSTGTTEITIPKRNGSMIATVWLNAHGNPGDYDDEEKSKNNSHDGDGLTAYEEYRGVISEGAYKRLDPQKKELGVAMEKPLYQKFGVGLDWFQQASDIDIVRFVINREIGPDHRFNKNFSQGHIYDQQVLRIASVRMNGDIAGKAFTSTDKPEIPVNTQVIAISPENIRRNFQNWSQFAQSIGQQLRWSESEYLAQTIAHEMGHGVKVSHHGDGSAPQGETAKQGSGPVYHIIDRNGAEINTRPYQIPVNDRVCPVPGSQASGDLSCMMAYVDVCDWARIEYADGSIGLFQSPLLPIGNKFCIKPDGTGLNAGSHTVGGVTYENYFGHAINGACVGQITLK